jgi:ferric-dicitrate binding protein FerR (iron transport regulator)
MLMSSASCQWLSLPKQMLVMKTPTDILSNVFRGIASEQERARLESWIAESADNRSIYEQAQAMWQELGFASEAFTQDRAAAWQMMASEIRPISTEEQKSLSRSIVKMVVLIAALFAIAGVASLVLNIGGNRQVKASKRAELLLLADGTRAYMDSGAAVRYGKTFGTRNRTITLSGEAMLEVSLVADRPLTIRTAAAKVFANDAIVNVVAAGASSFEVIAIKGAVEVLVAGKTYKVPMQNMATLDSTGAVTVIPADLNLIAWRSNKLVADKTPLAKLVKPIEKLVGKRLVFRASVSMSNPLTFTISPVSALATLDTLSQRLGLSYKVDKDQVVFY